MINSEIRLIIFFAVKDGEALYSQEKQDWVLTVAQIMNSLLPNSDLNGRKQGKTTRPFRDDLNQIPYDYTGEMGNRFKGLDLINRVPEELWSEVHELVQETGIKNISKKQKCKKANGCLRRPYKQLRKEEKLEGKGEKNIYSHLNAEFQRIARRDQKAFLSDQGKELEGNNGLGNPRDLFKKIRDAKGTFHAKMGSIKNRNNMDLTESEDIKKRWQEYTEELYKTDFQDPDNHDAVVTHLEPEILDCEVKRTSGSITKNKASGGDGIPVELIQILKDDSVKVLHSICQQIWKAQQWPQDWQRCLSKRIAKYAQIIAQLHSSHVLVK